MSDVNVHYNSERPAQLNTLAYAQGNTIHVAPGQESYFDVCFFFYVLFYNKVGGFM